MKLHISEVVSKEVTVEQFVQAMAPNITPPKFALGTVVLVRPKETGREPRVVVLTGASWQGVRWQYSTMEPNGTSNIASYENEENLKVFR